MTFKTLYNRYVRVNKPAVKDPTVYVANAARPKRSTNNIKYEDDDDSQQQSKQLPALKPDPNERVKSIRVAVVGQPNVGKSSLVNNILNYERSLVNKRME
jgi:predicted GTPase